MFAAQLHSSWQSPLFSMQEKGALGAHMEEEEHFEDALDELEGAICTEIA